MKKLIPIFLLLVIGGAGVGNADLIEPYLTRSVNVGAEKVATAEPVAPKVVPNQNWENICKEAKDCVVQVFSYVNEPNLLEPYKSPNRGMGCGTGFFISDDGYLLTNFHVVSFSVALYIQIPSLGKERFEVEYVGGSPQKDIALLRLKKSVREDVKKKMNVEKIPSLSLGDSDSLVEAQYIMALGYPLGQENLKVSIGSLHKFFCLSQFRFF